MFGPFDQVYSASAPLRDHPGSDATRFRLTVCSMTGFARAVGEHGPLRWTWEVKSVNGRSLDIRCRLPAGMDALELPARERAQRLFQRGHLVLNLTVQREIGAAKLRVNRAALDDLIAQVRDIAAAAAVAPPTLDGLLAVKGVVEAAEEEDSEEARAARETALLASLDGALARLKAARAEEGRKLRAVLAAQLDGVAAEVEAAARLASLRPEAVKARLKEQVARLLEAQPALPEDRLVQEAALLAAKGDVQEELDRLRAHVEAARGLLHGTDGEAVGRRLDFLAQEFNREANTLCAKAADLELTRSGLALKALIDQFREQVQNIE